MKLGVCAQVLYHLPFDRALATAAELGFAAIELPVDRGSPFVDLEEALAGGWRRIERTVAAAGLTISALSIHQESRLLLDPPEGDAGDPSVLGPGFAADRMIEAAELARRLGVGVVCGFTGCQDPSRWFPWPLADGYERLGPGFRERLLPVLDAYADRGVRFAHECHPRQLAYNTETALWAVELLERHPAFGFNFDPANLMLAGVDPVVFVVELGDLIAHAHAKDGELVEHNRARSGLLAHGAWSRRDRGFRFRVPGWGDLSWRRLITELRLAGYDGVLAVEHEDPTMGRMDGLEQSVRHLAPLMLREPLEGARWW